LGQWDVHTPTDSDRATPKRHVRPWRTRRQPPVSERRMNAAHVTTIGELRAAIDNGSLTELLADVGQGFRVVFGHNPSDEELAIWSVSLPAFIRVMPRSLDPIPVLIELKMPIGSERADLVLLGGQSEPRAIVVELKHWSGDVHGYAASPNLV